MPTIKEIADACGVTKPTVTKKLKQLDLWEGHVNKVGMSFEVDAAAASAVSAALASSVRKVEAEPAMPDKTVADVYAEYIAELRESNERLWEQIREKDDLIAELSRKLAENQPRQSFWSKLLPGGGGKGK